MQRRMRTAPLWTLFIYFALIYGAFQLIRGKPLEALVSGLVYGVLMTVVTLFTRRRDRRAVGGRPLSDVARLEQSLGKKGTLPTDFRDRVALQSLIARKKRQLRLGAIYAPIVFACVTVLAIISGATGHGSWWYVPVFVLITVGCVWASIRARRRLDQKASGLNAALS
jgi:membrane protein implicated in regulation of membrane protease activity